MGWDVFISHASEDKRMVAVPLKAALERFGISVWIDLEQITVGDSFRSKIDGGLQQCRFGVVILSPRFFKKPWAKAELDALVNMEMSVSGEKRLLPVIYDMSFEGLNQYSPLLAARKAINWSEGVGKVVGVIADIVLVGASATAIVSPQPPTIHQSASPKSLVLFMMRDGKTAYEEATEIESGTDETRLTIKCLEPQATALVQELGRTRSDLVAVAFGTTAILGRVTEAMLKTSGADQLGLLKLRNERTRRGNPLEMSFNDISADKFAEMRARRILLDEKVPVSKEGSLIDIASRSLMDHFIAGEDGFIKVKASPFPELYRQLAAEPATFISVAKLSAVLYLCLSEAVETVLRLELSLNKNSLEVNFSGRRARRYTNIDPPIISVIGMLALS